MRFSRALNAQIKISTLQDRTLHTRESSPLLSKARNSTRINVNNREGRRLKLFAIILLLIPSPFSFLLNLAVDVVFAAAAVFIAVDVVVSVIVAVVAVDVIVAAVVFAVVVVVVVAVAVAVAVAVVVVVVVVVVW